MTNERETGPDAGYRPVVLAGAVTVAALALTIILGANITVIAWGAAAWTVSLAVKSAAAADLANLGGRCWWRPVVGRLRTWHRRCRGHRHVCRTIAGVAGGIRSRRRGG